MTRPTLITMTKGAFAVRTAADPPHSDALNGGSAGAGLRTASSVLHTHASTAQRNTYGGSGTHLLIRTTPNVRKLGRQHMMVPPWPSPLRRRWRDGPDFWPRKLRSCG